MHRHLTGVVAGFAFVGSAITAIAASSTDRWLVLAQQTTVPARDESPEAKMSRRFPQKVKVADLIGLPMLDDGDVTLGLVQKVVRTPAGKVKLIVSYSKWFGWFGRPVAVPIEVVAILGRQIASLDMPPKDYESAATWTQTTEENVPGNEIIRIAVTRR
jgi:hypothetical protein